MARQPLIKEIKDEFYNKIHPITEIKAIFDEDGTSLEEILNTKVVTDVDDELSNVSINPVQNRIITEALNSKVDTSDLETVNEEINELSEEISEKPSTEELNEAINTSQNNLKDYTDRKCQALENSFSEALTALKNTAIARAVGAVGNTFTSVIAKLATIVDRGKVTQTLDTTTTSYTIPQGYHNGQGTVSISTQAISMIPTTQGTTVKPSNGKVLKSVFVGPQQHRETYTATARSSALDLGEVHNFRYINTDKVPSTTVNGGISVIFEYLNNPYIGIAGMGGFTKADWESLPVYGRNIISQGTHTYSLTGGLSVVITYNGSYITQLYLTNNSGASLSCYCCMDQIYQDYNTAYSYVDDFTLSPGASYNFLYINDTYHYIKMSSDTKGIMGFLTVRMWKV
jgi:hypothetical protein